MNSPFRVFMHGTLSSKVAFIGSGNSMYFSLHPQRTAIHPISGSNAHPDHEI